MAKKSRNHLLGSKMGLLWTEIWGLNPKIWEVPETWAWTPENWKTGDWTPENRAWEKT